METPKPFRAVIVGGGLVGLSAAHIFSKAGIDFVLLEKHDTPLIELGATLALWPQASRIFDQLGLLESLEPSLGYLHEAIVHSAEDGRIRMWDRTVGILGQNHGHPVKIIHRPDLVKFLYESLPETAKSRVLLGKQVVDIAVSEDGVEVSCADGSTVRGSIVIGADGVRSRVRLLMRALVAGVRPDDLSPDQRDPYVATYRQYCAAIPSLPGIPAYSRYDGTGDGLTTQLINSRGIGWYSVYEKLADGPTARYTRYTEADKRAIVEKYGHLYVAPGWRLRDVDARRRGEAALINLEEGLVDRWSFRRVVLMGDAVRKLEPHAGLGYNCGLMDLVELTNGLRRLLLPPPQGQGQGQGQGLGGSPDTPALEALFRGYQERRQRETKALSDLSMKSVRMVAWLTWKDRAMSRYVLPYIPLTAITFNNEVGPLVSEMPVLEWLGEKELPVTARIPWKNYPLGASRGKEEVAAAGSAAAYGTKSLAVLLILALAAAQLGHPGVLQRAEGGFRALLQMVK